ncbi:hypothetical protein [Endozoicomonas elysicola]|uniref:Uncharacterized protein n=1 Tax=Endozoicomonas elysicola TaxID=305900 RepID=A0A081K832_9GAMM|nr:hypothetical protein [Endozoicomonas elysicola]KEI70308.1 hypothetical protein GV64_05780 [Endozoicomonas elysicola]
MSEKNKSMIEVSELCKQIQLICYCLKLISDERERIKKSISAFNQYTSDDDRGLWLSELNECDLNYAELQHWLSDLIASLGNA